MAEKVLGDVTHDFWVLGHAGISWKTEEQLLLALAIKNLAKEHNLNEARFFGVIYGTVKDYYVIEAKETDEVLTGLDPALAAINTHAFFVANSVLGPWSKLPTLSIDVLVKSRAIRRLFSGNLETTLGFYPPLANAAKNKEKFLLRAQLARISASTVIAPASFYNIADETVSRVDPSPNIDVLAQKAAAKWIHIRGYLYPSGTKADGVKLICYHVSCRWCCTCVSFGWGRWMLEWTFFI